LLPIIGFSIVGYTLLNIARHSKRKRNFKKIDIKAVIIPFIVVGGLYGLLLYKRIGSKGFASSNNVYHLPGLLIALTIFVPYLYVWFVGLWSANEILGYSRNVDGLFYRQALRLFSIGLITVIFSVMIFQYATSLALDKGYLQLNVGVIIIQIINLVRCVGFIFIAMGLSKLKKIEEV
jgi:hypothetical protein